MRAQLTVECDFFQQFFALRFEIDRERLHHVETGSCLTVLLLTFKQEKGEGLRKTNTRAQDDEQGQR